MGTIINKTKNMKYKLPALLFGWMCTSAATGQIKVQGTVMNEKKSPIEYANIVWLSLPDSTFIQGTVSGVDGTFTLEYPGKEKGLLRVSCIGYATLYLPADAGKPISGELLLSDDTQMMQEVMVHGEPPRTRIKGGSLLTNVAGTLLEKAGTAENMLSRIPGVSNDGGTVSVFGRGTAEVYINSRKIHDLSELDRLASNEVKSVEVINNPGARYAASVKAVVRITTKRIQGDGFGFNNRTHVAYNKKWSLLDQFNFNYRTGGFDLSGTLMGSNKHDWNKKEISQQTRLNKTWQQQSNIQENEHSQQIYTMLSANYVFNPNHTAGARYSFTRLPGYDSWGSMESEVSEDNTSKEHLLSLYDSRDQQSQHSLNFYYQGNINEWKIDFNADILKRNNHSANLTHENLHYYTEDTKDERTINTLSRTNNGLYAGKLVLSHTIAGGDFSIGGEYVHTKHHNQFSNAEAILKDNDSKIREKNFSGFLEYSHSFGLLYVQAGVRYEHITSEYYKQGTKSEMQSKHYNNWFPSATVMLPLEKLQLSLSYTSDILRPSYHELRPNIVYNNRYTYESGNPLLHPQLSQNLILNAVYNDAQLTAGYRHTKNAIVMASSPYSPDNPTIALLKTINAESYDNLFASLAFSPTVGIWSPQFIGTISQQWFRADTPEGKHILDTPIVSLSWDNSLQLPCNFLVNADLSWSSTGHSENIKLLRSTWSADLSLFKSWMNSRLSCQIRIHDLFNSTRTHTIAYLGELQTLGTYLPAQSRSVSLTIRYKFNQARSKYKGTGAGETQKDRM